MGIAQKLSSAPPTITIMYVQCLWLAFTTDESGDSSFSKVIFVLSDAIANSSQASTLINMARILIHTETEFEIQSGKKRNTKGLDVYPVLCVLLSLMAFYSLGSCRYIIY